MSDFQPTADPSAIRLRAGVLNRIRAFFQGHGFLEVETPLLSADTVVDRHIDPIGVDVATGAGEGSTRRMWLQTSPEFAMKRMLAAAHQGGDLRSSETAGSGDPRRAPAGIETAIYQITRAFRAGETGPLHKPEFTIVEWYRTGDDMRAGIQLLSDLTESILDRGPAERISYRDAFGEHAGVDPLTATTAELIEAVCRARVDAPESLGNDRDAWLDLLLVERVAPRLGTSQPAILFDYPASQAALAVVRNDDPPVAERFELFVDGIELANGYHELLDAEVLRERNATVNDQRVADGKTRLPEDSRLLAAMDHGLPACAGTALGLDRLIMIAAGAKTLADELP